MNEAGSRTTWFSEIISFIVTILTHRGKSFSTCLGSNALWVLINRHWNKHMRNFILFIPIPKTDFLICCYNFSKDVIIFHRRCFYSHCNLSLKPCKCCQIRMKARNGPPCTLSQIQKHYLLIQQIFENSLCAAAIKMNKTYFPVSVVSPAHMANRQTCPQCECGDRSLTDFVGSWRPGAQIRLGNIASRRWQQGCRCFPRRMTGQPSGKCVRNQRVEDRRGWGKQKVCRKLRTKFSGLCRYFDSLNPYI